MSKNNNRLKGVFYLLAFLIFTWFEYRLYQLYTSEKNIREYVKAKNTQTVKDSFLLREKYFYSDKSYLEGLKILKSKEESAQNPLLKKGGETTIEQI